MSMTILMDIDGVLTDNSHRDHLAGGDWVEWNKASHADKPIDAGVAILNSLNERHKIIFLTSRFDSNKEMTAEWLKKHTNVKEPILYMRPHGDPRKCFEVKEEIYLKEILIEHGTVDLFVEDNLDNLKTLSKYGVRGLHVQFPLERDL